VNTDDEDLTDDDFDEYEFGHDTGVESERERTLRLVDEAIALAADSDDPDELRDLLEDLRDDVENGVQFLPLTDGPGDDDDDDDDDDFDTPLVELGGSD
jgi:hypothetical protein